MDEEDTVEVRLPDSFVAFAKINRGVSYVWTVILKNEAASSDGCGGLI